MRRCALLIVLFLLSACDLDGRSLTYPGASVYQPPERDFHFHYLAPPWRVDPTPAEGSIVQLSVPALSEGAGTIPASHQLGILRLTKVSLPSAAAEEEHLAEKQAVRTITRPPTAIKALTGEVGWDVQSYKDLQPRRAYYRETFFAAGGAVVRFSLLSAYPTDDPDVDDLIQSFSVGPDPGTPGPGKAE